jgi:hypothetical protein
MPNDPWEFEGATGKDLREFLHNFPIRCLAERFSSRCFVDFGGEDEIAFGQAVDFVSPNLDPRLAPGKIDVGMMVLLFGDFPDTVNELQGLAKVGELKFPLELLLAEDFPSAVKLVLHLFQRVAFEGRRSAVARFAFFFCKVRTHNGIENLNPIHRSYQAINRYRALARPPIFPPLRAGERLTFLPRPEPLRLPPPVILLTVAQARRFA